MRPTGVAVVGYGATEYYKRGKSPHAERKLLLMAIDEAARMAGIDAADIDGFVSYGADLQDGPRVTGPWGTKELRWSSLVWGGGAGGSSAAIAHAEAAIRSGHAETMVVYRRLRNRVAGGSARP